MTASSTCSSPRAMSSEMPDFAMKDPNNLLVQGEDGKFIEMADKAGVASTETSRGGGARRLQPRRPRRSPRGEPQGAGRRSGATRRQGAGNWLELQLSAARRQRERHRRLGRGEDGARRPAPRDHLGRRACLRPVGLDPFRARRAPTTAEVRVRWPGERLERALRRSTANGFAILDKASRPGQPWQPPR